MWSRIADLLAGRTAVAFVPAADDGIADTQMTLLGEIAAMPSGIAAFREENKWRDRDLAHLAARGLVDGSPGSGLYRITDAGRSRLRGDR